MEPLAALQVMPVLARLIALTTLMLTRLSRAGFVFVVTGRNLICIAHTAVQSRHGDAIVIPVSLSQMKLISQYGIHFVTMDLR